MIENAKYERELDISLVESVLKKVRNTITLKSNKIKEILKDTFTLSTLKSFSCVTTTFNRSTTTHFRNFEIYNGLYML